MSLPPVPSPAAAAGRTSPRTQAGRVHVGAAVAWMQRSVRRGARHVGMHVGAQVALVWLLLALVVAPTLGRLHEVTHGTTLDRVHAGQVLLTQRQAHATATAPALTLAQAWDKTQGDTPSTRASADATAIPAGGIASTPGLLDRLAGHHNAADCLLLDQLAWGDALYSVPLVVPAPVLAQAPPAPPADRVGVLHVALFQARGPPLLSSLHSLNAVHTAARMWRAVG